MTPEELREFRLLQKRCDWAVEWIQYWQPIISQLQKDRVKMIQQVQSLIAAANAAVTTLNSVAAALKAGTVSPADLVAVQAATDGLNAAVTAAQAEIPPA